MASLFRHLFKPEPYTQSEEDKLVQQELRNAGKLPDHVAIIMDGNGRWAAQRGLERKDGHMAGEQALSDVVEGAIEVGGMRDVANVGVSRAAARGSDVSVSRRWRAPLIVNPCS